MASERIIVEWAVVFKESIGIFFGIISALLVWWLKQYFENRKKRNVLLAAISAELGVIRSKIIQTLEKLTKHISKEQEPENYEFKYEPKIYNSNLENLGQINDHWLIKNLVYAYGLIDLYNEETQNLDQINKLPVCARQIELLYDVYDEMVSYIRKNYGIAVDDDLDRLQKLYKHLDVTMKLHELIYDKYPDLAVKLYAADKK